MAENNPNNVLAYINRANLNNSLGKKDDAETDLQTAIKETANYVREKGPKAFDYSYPLEIISDKTPATWKDRLM